MQGRFIKKALLLTAVTFVMRAVGAVFMIYISNKIGAEGIGLFQIVSSIYMLFVTIATSGISLAVTRMVSEQTALCHYESATASFKSGFFLSLVLGLVAAALLFFGSGFIGNTLLAESRSIVPIKLLSIGLPFLSTASVIRGYFTGLMKPIKSVSGDIVEQLAVMGVTIPLISLFAKDGLESACCCLVIGSVLGEILSCIYSIILFLAEKKQTGGEKLPHLTRHILSIAIPVAASNYVRSALTAIENMLVPRSLRRFGESESSSLSKYGAIKGMALPVMMLPSAMMSAFATLLVPEVAAARAKGNNRRIDYIVNMSIKVTAIFSLFVAGAFFCAGGRLCELIYSDKSVGATLIALTPLVPLMYLDMVVDSILKGLDEQLAAMRYNIADSFLRAALIFLLVPILGIKGYYIMLYTGTIFNASLSLLRLIKVSHVRFRPFKWLIAPLALVTFSYVTVGILPVDSLVWQILIALLLYSILLVVCRLLWKEDFDFLRGIFQKN